MPTVIHQLLALMGPKRQHLEGLVSKAFGILSDSSKLSGMKTTYQPFADDDKERPTDLESRNVRVQFYAKDVLNELSRDLIPVIDLFATIEHANTAATAPIMLNQRALILDAQGQPMQVPVTMLINLEKIFKELLEKTRKMVTLSEALDWHYEKETRLHVTQPVKTIRQQKRAVNHVLAPATPEHPAQVQVHHQDVQVGEFSCIRMSSAPSLAEQKDLLARLQEIYDAIVLARHEANSKQVTQTKYAEQLLNFAFGPINGAAS